MATVPQTVNSCSQDQKKGVCPHAVMQSSVGVWLTHARAWQPPELRNIPRDAQQIKGTRRADGKRAAAKR